MNQKQTFNQTPVAIRRQRLIFGVVAIVVMWVGGWLIANSGGGASTESATAGPATGVLDDEGRPIDTSPFRPAEPGAIGSTTLPADALRTSSTTTTAPTTTTSTTIPLPARSSDPICASTTAIIEALRIVTGPGGASPENLRATAAKFAETADLMESSGRTDLGAVVALTRAIAAELPEADNDLEAAAIYNRLLSPTDPEIVPVAQDFGRYLQGACPELLTIEP